MCTTKVAVISHLATEVLLCLNLHHFPSSQFHLSLRRPYRSVLTKYGYSGVCDAFGAVNVHDKKSKPMEMTKFSIVLIILSLDVPIGVY